MSFHVATWLSTSFLTAFMAAAVPHALGNFTQMIILTMVGSV